MHAFHGILLLLRTPRLWGLCIGPLLIALFVYLLLGVIGGILLIPHLSQWLATLPGNGWMTAILGGAALIVWLVLFPFLFVLFGGVFFGMFFEAISEAVERQVRPGTITPKTPMPFATMMGDTIGRLTLNITLGIAAFLLGFALGPIPGILVAGIIGLLDYSSPAHLRRGITLPAQMKRLLGPPDIQTLSFALIAGLLSLIPVLGVFLIPGLVAGGTLMTLERENREEV